MNDTKAAAVKVRVTLDLETQGDTDAEELAYLLNMLRWELSHWAKWNGKVRRVEFDR